MLFFEIIINGEWNGIVLWLNTGLFIAAIAFYSLSKTKKQKA
jgi:hypothetical protein